MSCSFLQELCPGYHQNFTKLLLLMVQEVCALPTYYFASFTAGYFSDRNYYDSRFLRAYDQIQILTQGGPAGSTRTLLYLYYQMGFEQFDMGRAAAAVVILMIIGLSLALLQIRLKSKEA